MSMIRYEHWVPGNPDSAPKPDAARDIERAAEICRSYRAQGYDLTLRQLYYQFVSRGWIPNTEQQYKRLGDIVSRARMCGLLDWGWIVDRTRSLYGTTHTTDPAEAISDTIWRYHVDKWEHQKTRVEVWVEKEALAGVIGRAASTWDLNYFPARGYGSISALWQAGQRIGRYIRDGQDVVLLYLGDHDPSGIDMSRDVADRLTTFLGRDAQDLEVRRIALNMDQVEQYNPPPNPTKLTDSRAGSYLEQFGSQCWELDALDPATLDALIQDHVRGIVDQGAYDAAVERENADKDLLRAASYRWPEIVDLLQS
jgi:hypothetical protein